MKRVHKADSLTTLARNNKVVMQAYFIDVLVMTIFCFLQATSGLQTWTYVLIVALLGFLPLAAERHFWKRNHETSAIKYLTVIGFAIFYTYTLFTSTNQLVFVFVIPMLLVISVYNDVRYSLLFSTGAVLESFILVIVGAGTGKFGYLGMDYGIIQIVIMILIEIYSLLTTRTLNRNYEQILSDLSELSEEMKSGIKDISCELERLIEASKTTQNAMQEVSAGTNDTAEAVQSQLLQTHSIKDWTSQVEDAISSISDNMKETLATLQTGNRHVASLVEKVDASVNGSTALADKLKTLDASIAEMDTITELISTIARQTGLLALNARIEASHAGEFGKGFAVVASEFSAMAAQTNDATAQIAELIENVSAGIREVVASIYQMIDGINEEKQSTESTSESFDSIAASTLFIQKYVEQLISYMAELKTANSVISDSIETISAVSEEVSAHAAETMNAEEQNKAILSRIDRKMQQLINLIQK